MGGERTRGEAVSVTGERRKGERGGKSGFFLFCPKVLLFNVRLPTAALWYSGVAGRANLGIISPSWLLSFAHMFPVLLSKVFSVQLSKAKACTLLFMHTIKTYAFVETWTSYILT